MAVDRPDIQEYYNDGHLFSALICCKECGSFFKRTVRTYKNAGVYWTCPRYSGQEAESCSNAVEIGEEELIQTLEDFFKNIIKTKKKIISHMVSGKKAKAVEDIIDVRQMTNFQLKRIVRKIEVDRDGNVDIFLWQFDCPKELPQHA